MRMGRPTKYGAAAIIAAAAALVGEAGPDAITMSAVATRLGAPSGSIYHRFGSRGALRGAVWLDTVTRFHQQILDLLDEQHPTDSALQAARATIEFCRTDADRGAVLLAGRAAFTPDDWPADVLDTVIASDKKFFKKISAVARRVAEESGTERQLVYLAIVDLPYAAVRRHLNAHQPIPAELADIVADAAARILTPGHRPAE